MFFCVFLVVWVLEFWGRNLPSLLVILFLLLPPDTILIRALRAAHTAFLNLGSAPVFVFFPYTTHHAGLE